VRCVQNIGGIANVTYLPGGQKSVVAFDTGPGNMLIDALVSLASDGKKRFDLDGRIAARGTLDTKIFRQLQSHPYFARRPPKSTGREEFGISLATKLFRSARNQPAKIESLVHTLTRLTAWSIVDAYGRYLPAMPDEVILCGGGIENRVLVKMLEEEFGTGGPKLRRIDEFGIPNKAKEAASFALLGAATLDGVASNVPSVTGAQQPVILGVIARPAGR
jgi:anhydro-N-acetylmuramic acid kinase